MRLANVRFSYKAAHDDELDLEVDDVIEVIEDAETGWMKGKIRSSGRVGLFPTNFVHFVGMSFPQILYYSLRPRFSVIRTQH